jgi:superfamily II DNA helicase RecQ
MSTTLMCYGLVHQQITGEMELLFHGCGGGGERFTTVTGLYAKQIRLFTQTKSLYYVLVHDKKASVQNSKDRPVTHKLPDSMVSYYLLYRRISIALVQKTSDVISKIPNRRFLMKDSVANHFGIDRSVISDKDIRKLWTTITNLVFEDPGRSGRLVAEKDAAELCNHTSTIHNNFYATHLVNRMEMMYDTYHAFLGQHSRKNTDTVQTMFIEISREFQTKSLQFLFGGNATFRVGQDRMIDICCNNHEKHNFIKLPCGGGKSLSVLLPVTAQYLMRCYGGCNIFIVPYAFLKDSLFMAFKDRLSGIKDWITILNYSAADIPDNSEYPLPTELINFQNIAQIIILTIDAASNLFHHHRWVMDQWKRLNCLRSIYVDEIQTMISEFGFRLIYQTIRGMAMFEVPISLLSGSFHHDLVQPIMCYLGLSESVVGKMDYNFIDGGNSIGTGFDFEVVSTLNVPGVCALILHIRKVTSGHLHIICKSKSQCKQLSYLLREKGIQNEEVNADISSSDQKKIASDWYEGKIEVLISTIVALVGNENPKCKGIIVVGVIYNLASLVQAIGRLRPNQRGPNSKVTQVLFKYVIERTYNETNNYDSQSSKEKLDQLFNAHVIEEKQTEQLKMLFNYDNYIDFFHENGCYLHRLATACGESIMDDCMRCTWCKYKKNWIKLSELKEKEDTDEDTIMNVRNMKKRSENTSQQVEPTLTTNINSTMQSITNENPIKKIARLAKSFLQDNIDFSKLVLDKFIRLESMCLVCQQISCIGDCQTGCYICGGQHRVNECPYRSTCTEGKSLNQFLATNKICSICLVPIEYGQHGMQVGSNKEIVCSLKKRVRGLIRDKCHTKFDKYIRRIFASREMFTK